MVIAKPRMGLLSLHHLKHTDELLKRRWVMGEEVEEQRKKKMTRRLELPSAGGGEE